MIVMKKYLLIIICIAFFGKTSLAQFYTGIEAKVAYPIGYFNSQVEFGYGPVFNLGYLANNKLDFSICYELQFFNTQQPNFRITSESFSFKYKINLDKCIPYLGLRTGIFHSKTEIPAIVIGQNIETVERKENAFGFAPTIGVIIDTRFSKKVNIDISTSYSVLYFNSKYTYLSMSAGIIYIFK